MEGYLDYGDENWHELPDSESHGVVNRRDAYWDDPTGTTEDIQVTEFMEDGSMENYFNTNYWDFGVVKLYDAKINIIIDYISCTSFWIY